MAASYYFQELKRYIHEVFSYAGADTETIARYMLSTQERVIDDENISSAVKEVVSQHTLSSLYHFTHISNVAHIVEYGLVPRKILELEAVKMVLNPHFSDKHRLDRTPDFSCMSISFPNYSMFYKKRSMDRGGWAVLELDANLLGTHYFEYTAGNAAATNAERLFGAQGLGRLFSNESLRVELNLRQFETTDPQAESLTDSFIKPEHIKRVFVENSENRDFLKCKNITAFVNTGLFMPRRDWQYWRSIGVR